MTWNAGSSAEAPESSPSSGGSLSGGLFRRTPTRHKQKNSCSNGVVPLSCPDSPLSASSSTSLRQRKRRTHRSSRKGTGVWCGRKNSNSGMVLSAALLMVGMVVFLVWNTSWLQQPSQPPSILQNHDQETRLMTAPRNFPALSPPLLFSSTGLPSTTAATTTSGWYPLAPGWSWITNLLFVLFPPQTTTTTSTPTDDDDASNTYDDDNRMGVPLVAYNNNATTLNVPADKTTPHNNAADWDGKARVVQLLLQAGVAEVTSAMREKLPTWQHMTTLWGSEPRIVHGGSSGGGSGSSGATATPGATTPSNACTRYQQLVPNPSRRTVGAAGLTGTGTTLLVHLLQRNCEFDSSSSSSHSYHVKRQVPWGKATPVHQRHQTTTTNSSESSTSSHQEENVLEDMLPIVMIRSPLRWLQELCRTPRNADWTRVRRRHFNHTRTTTASSTPQQQRYVHSLSASLSDHHLQSLCPNLQEKANVWNPVHVSRREQQSGTPVVDHYPSVAHWFTQWYRDYWRSTSFPFLMVRLEDLIVHPYKTIREICECAGGQTVTQNPEEFQFQFGGRVKNGASAYLDAWMQYGPQSSSYAEESQQAKDNEINPPTATVRAIRQGEFCAQHKRVNYNVSSFLLHENQVDADATKQTSTKDRPNPVATANDDEDEDDDAIQDLNMGESYTKTWGDIMNWDPLDRAAVHEALDPDLLQTFGYDCQW